MILSKGRARQVFIFCGFVFWLAVSVSLAVENIPKMPRLGTATGVLMVTEAVCVLFYGLAFRPRRWRWAARIVPLLFILAPVGDWLYAGGLPADKPFGVQELVTIVSIFATDAILLFLLFRYGYSPKLPPDAFSARVLFVALLGAGFLRFIEYVPVFAPRIRVTHNYLWELNELTRPAPYDGSKNAALDYRRLADRIGAMPEDVNRVKELWPGDMNETERRAVRTWAMSDPGVVEELVAASRKPQYWIERHEPKGNLMDVKLPENPDIAIRVTYLLLHAQLKACEEENMDAAVEEILAAYSMGTQLAGPRTTLEQLVGMAICNFSAKSAFEVLSKVHVESAVMAKFQDRLHDLSTRWDHGFDCRAGRLMVLDWIQRAFSDHGDGGGCISRRRSWRLHWGWVRIDRADTVNLLEEIVASLGVENRVTPWQCRIQRQNTLGTLERRKNPALWDLVSPLSEGVTLSWRLRTRTAALLATLAIFRYRADTGHLPASLNELVSTGCLDAVPMDPFGDGPLVYRRQDGDFVLYSRGLDFDDDGGIPSYWGKGDKGGDQVFWPVDSSAERSR